MGSDGCAPCRDAATAPAAHDAPERLVEVSVLEQRDEQAGREGVARGRAVDRFDDGRDGACDLLPVLQQQRPLGAERHRDEPVSARQRLELEAVDDRQVGIHLHGPRGRGVQAEDSRARLPRRLDRVIGDLELTEDGVVLGKRHRGELGVGAWRDDDLGLAAGVDEDHRDPGRTLQVGEVERDTGLAEPCERLLRERVAPHRPDHRHVGPETRACDGLVSRPCRLDTGRTSHP